MAKKKSTNCIPAATLSDALSGEQLAEKLQGLIGRDFKLSGKPKTDGSTLRKMVETELASCGMPLAEDSEYKVFPLKKKGVPKLVRYMAESFIVTTGTTYNLQVWNRVPNSRRTLIKYNNGDRIRCCDINCVMVKIDVDNSKVASIIVASPKHIESNFGKFGVPTIKYQAIINPTTRSVITNDSEDKSLMSADTEVMKPLLTKLSESPLGKIADEPEASKLLPIEEIAKRTISQLVGTKLDAADTKTCGQALERKVATLLGYDENDSLLGGYPDIRNQALEVKVQDAPTIDLGKESPSNPVKVFDGLDLTTEDVRYLIALTNPNTSIIEGIVLVPGRELENAFTMVDGVSYKCQRSIPMEYFEKYKGKSVFNPKV